MNTLEIAYKILYSLEHKKKADYMGQIISPTVLGVDDEDWLRVIETLIEEEYIAGAKVTHDILGNAHVDAEKCRITLKGAEYLSENSTMKKFAKVATDVIDILKPRGLKDEHNIRLCYRGV